MKGPPLCPGGGNITWPDQVALLAQTASSTRKIKSQTCNLKAASARQATGGPPTPTQATQAPRQHTGNPPHPAPAPSHLRTEVLLNLEPDPNPRSDPKLKPAPERSDQQQLHHHQYHPRQPRTPQKQRRLPKQHRASPNPNPNQDPPPTTTRASLLPAAAATTEAATQHDPVQTLVNIPISKRPVIHLPKTTTAACQTDRGT